MFVGMYNRFPFLVNQSLLSLAGCSVQKTIREAENFFVQAGTSFPVVQAAYRAAHVSPHLIHARKGPTLVNNVYSVETAPLGYNARIETEKVGSLEVLSTPLSRAWSRTDGHAFWFAVFGFVAL